MQQSSNIETIEYTLSGYLLSNLDCIDKKNLKEISIETQISQASIFRFCQKFGYKGVTHFINDLYLETGELKNKLKFFEYYDIQILDTMISGFLKECEQAISGQIDELCQRIRTSEKIMFYGHKNYMSCFQYLISYCYFNKKEVITNMSLSKNNQIEKFYSLTKNDLLIIVEPYINLNTYKELTFIQNDTINNIYSTPAKIIYIGQNSQNDVELCLNLPYTYYDYFYKNFFNKLDMILTLKLKE